MVIQSNMSPKAIVEVWSETREIFNLYNVPINDQTLGDLVKVELLPELLTQLNNVVGSSSLTCVEGG